MTARFKNIAVRWGFPVLASVVSAICLAPGALLAQNYRTNMEMNKKIVQDGFEKWSNGTGSFFDLVSEDVVWTITGSSPISKTYTSRRQFMDEVIVPLNDRLSKRIVPKLRGLYADGDMVVALWDGKATAKDGLAYNNTYSWYMKLKGGKIVEVVAFFDTIDLASIWARVGAAYNLPK